MERVNPDLFVKVVINRYINKNKTIEVLRKFTHSSIGTIIENLENKDSIFEVNLVSTDIYRGSTELSLIIDALQAIGAILLVSVNGEYVETKCFLSELNTKLKNVERKDIY
ncbi:MULTISPECIES: hypothetical protein [Shewanella]|jgi:hypothetical protein|uniref:hypothetical protein n=1 Tax=Shewanella TaxID=22 RepID=UPI000C3DDCB6|nr:MULTISPECIES: hypothetical protein [Shewanella]NCQ43590.1 hypothetical protein [Shewanella frigidimarina]MBB1320779.1 hypothetical protein [Shewanella sp. SR43-8]NCO69964.1 hypothetical protein [Shewanella vesiculosa]NCP35504.1 hypothetical protein [Shewanella vesiculosa]NCP68085.1 hypothetical protein [Shewanella vesiculosa]|tara:strand:- start:302 stop:634 length:333 start_codon:yes stop_codon:yes gene_type:complete